MLTPLPFDSELFSYPVGKCIVQNPWDEKGFLQQAGSFKLVYLFSEKELNMNSSDFLLADTKVVFEKTVESQLEDSKTITEYSGPLSQDLIALALASGEYSRFKVDPRMSSGEFEKLYKIWITKAWEKGEVLVFEKMEGMVTWSLENNSAQIGLIAVRDTSRGKGIGESMVKKAEALAYEKGAMKMKIPTQKANVPAINLYHKLGYKVSSQTYVYHYWNPF